jgi:hypothetical protein
MIRMGTVASAAAPNPRNPVTPTDHERKSIMARIQVIDPKTATGKTRQLLDAA